MTTIIVTTISILLAAACTLMITFYGGDMLTGGRVTANADIYMNAGNNVIAASDQFRILNRYDPPSLDALIDGGFLKQYPFTQQSTITVFNGKSRLTIDGIDAVTCGQINQNLKRSPTEWGTPDNLNDGSGGMGCQLGNNGGTFYAQT